MAENRLLRPVRAFLPGFVDGMRRLHYRWNWVALILLLQLAAVAFETLGLGSIVPILEYMDAAGDTAKLAESSDAWQVILSVSDEIGIEVGLGTLLIGAFIAIVLRQAFSYLRQVFSFHVQNELIRNVRDRGFQLYLNARFETTDRIRPGVLVNEMTTELARAIGAISAAIDCIAYCMLGACYLAIVLVLSPTLSLAAILILLAVALLLARITRDVRHIGQGVTDSNRNVSSFLVERLGAVRLVRLSGVEAAETETFARFTRVQRDRMIGLQRLIALYSVLIEPVIMVFAFVILYVTVEGQLLSFETTILFFFILMRLAPIGKELMLRRQTYLGTIPSVDVVKARLDALEAAPDPVGGTRAFQPLRDGIAFADVHFSYEAPGKPAALHGVDLFIPANRLTAIVGPSGAGKSTLLDLLASLRTPQTGTIRYDGVAQAEFATSSLRGAMAFAPQTPQMFDGTFADHIRLGRPGASDAEIRRAAELAQAAAFIERHADGYDGGIGPGGSALSGGQRQRLDLARALVRGAPILLLDEPTSNLDPESEALFRQALQHIRNETRTTIIMIGHHLPTVSVADQIVVLIDGRIAETGTHDELVRAGGWYAGAFRRQALHAPMPDAPTPLQKAKAVAQ
ncbi:MAG: ABC transporter ATP-binding protein [Alphaproteobacteria bacterium]